LVDERKVLCVDYNRTISKQKVAFTIFCVCVDLQRFMLNSLDPQRMEFSTSKRRK